MRANGQEFARIPATGCNGKDTFRLAHNRALRPSLPLPPARPYARILRREGGVSGRARYDSRMAVAGISWLGGSIPDVLKGVAGNVTDRVLSGHVRALKVRFAGLQGRPENEHIAQSARVAQCQALERVIREYRDTGRPEWQAQPHLRPEMFFARSLEFCAVTIGRCRKTSIKLNYELTPSVGAGPEPFGAGAGRDRVLCEDIASGHGEGRRLSRGGIDHCGGACRTGTARAGGCVDAGPVARNTCGDAGRVAVLGLPLPVL